MDFLLCPGCRIRPFIAKKVLNEGIPENFIIPPDGFINWYYIIKVHYGCFVGNVIIMYLLHIALYYSIV